MPSVAVKKAGKLKRALFWKKRRTKAEVDEANDHDPRRDFAVNLSVGGVTAVVQSFSDDA